MATDREFLTSGGEAEFSEQPIKQVVSSALKENDGDLRRRSLPVRGIAQHHAVSDTPRSSSANGGCDTQQLTLSLHTETKAAFEDSSCGYGANKTSGDQVSNDESIAILTSPNIAGNVFRAIEYATCKKEDDSSTTTSNEGGNHAQEDFSGQRQRHMAKERPHHAFRNQQKSLLFSGEPSYQTTENTRNMELSSQQQPVAEIDFKHKDFEGNGTICNENSDEKSKEPDRETMIWHEQVENTNKTETRERSDTIESLVTFPRRQSETQRRPSCSSQLTSPPWSGEASRSRRVSVGGTSNFHTPDTTEKSDLPATRRGSRRRSSIAASALGSSNATQSRRDSVQGDGKKGSIGFGTLASSLVKWKINTLRAAKRAKETIAKDAKHQEFMDRTADRIKTELPRSLLVSIQEEGYPIILRTVQAYRSQLGAKHKLTVQASDRLADLLRDLKSPY